MPHTPFIETQFPLALLSSESYKERKAGAGQTLTGLGKWWGRKPLILVRAVIAGLLMPASDDPLKDQEVFLRILTMDSDGLWQRKNKKLTATQVATFVSPEEGSGILDYSGSKVTWISGANPSEKERLERLAFNRMSYDEKLSLCLRPEQIDGPSQDSWRVINDHLDTNASTLQQLFQELSLKAYGRTARVGDVFCGGGSIPFEAARLGLEAFGSDLNPVAALLTWVAINLLGGGPEIQQKFEQAQKAAWEAANIQIDEWGIEQDGKGWRADAYLYCVEAQSPATGLWVPLAPSWVISEKYKVVAELVKNENNGNYDICIVTGAKSEQLKKAKLGTVQDSAFICPETGNRYSITSLRGDRQDAKGQTVYGLRLWENEDLVPRSTDTFQERLYCIRWVSKEGNREFRSVTNEDLERENKVMSLLNECFADWQNKGYIPSKTIPRDGEKTEEPIRTRGWTHWHHLFNPRQLLEIGLIVSNLSNESNLIGSGVLLLAGYIADNNSRLCGWNPHKSKGPGNIRNTFSNQALNTLSNYGKKTLTGLETPKILNFEHLNIHQDSKVSSNDARINLHDCIFWITDPPYADAVNYHELSDFFLSWYENHLPKLFPDWYNDSHSALAVKGSGEDFKRSMVEIYTNLTHNMPDDGFQVVMFTHQDAGVWADLGMILWAAGLKVTAAWTIGTETTSGLKKGNYVQGTVLLVLRKRIEQQTVFLDELYPRVDDEVKNQLDHMHRVDEGLLPQFGDTDYQLGAYAAALRVLTSYAEIEGQDIRHELFRKRKKREQSPFEKVIDRAVSIAAGYLIPRGIERHLWTNLNSYERLYLRGLELERHGELRNGAYMELARGFGVSEYKFLLGSSEANAARFKTPSEFKRNQVGEGEWGDSLLRHVLFAIYNAENAQNVREGFNYLKSARRDYWSRRTDIIQLLAYILYGREYNHLNHWRSALEFTELLKGLVANDFASGGSDA